MSEPDQYDMIDELYERVKHLPVGVSEQATVLSALPALRGKSLLDVACGTGFYPRLFRSGGRTCRRRQTRVYKGGVSGTALHF
jgi:hypothetical protein